MEVSIKSKGYGFIGSEQRKKFYQAQWIGVVTIEGRSGALMINFEGHFMVFYSATAIVKLDYEEAWTAWGEAVASKQTMRMRTVTIDDASVEVAKRLGGGNLSLGLRKAVAAHLKVFPGHPLAPDPTPPA